MAMKDVAPDAKKRKKTPAYRLHAMTEQDLGSLSDDAFSEVESLAEEMQDGFANMDSNNLGDTEKCVAYGEAADALETVSQVEVPECISHLNVTPSELRPTRKGRGTSRATRLANAVSWLEACVEAANEADLTEAAADERDEYVNEVENAINELNDVNFPGMYG